MDFTNYYPSLSNNGNETEGGYDYDDGTIIGGNINIRPVYLTWSGGNDRVTRLKEEGIKNEATLPNIKIFFKGISDNNLNMIPKKVYLQLYTYKNDSRSKSRQDNSNYVYNWTDKQEYEINGVKRIGKIIKKKNEVLKIEDHFIEIQNPNQETVLNITNLSLTTPAKQTKEVNGYYNLGLYFINPMNSIYKNNHENYKISQSTDYAEENANETFTELNWSEDECLSDYEWYNEGKIISLFIDNTYYENSNVIFDKDSHEQNPICLKAQGDDSSICGVLVASDTIRFKLPLKLEPVYTYGITNLAFDLDVSKRNRKADAKALIRFKIDADEVGEVDIYTSSSEIQVYRSDKRNDKRYNKLTNLDISYKNPSLSECWLMDGAPKLLPGKDLYGTKTFQVQFQIPQEADYFTCSNIEAKIENYEPFFDFKNEKVLKILSEVEFEEVKASLLRNIEYPDMSILNPSCYYYAMALIHRIADENIGAISEGTDYFEKYRQKEENPKNMGYDIQATISEEWEKYYTFSSDKNKAYEADMILNDLTRKFKQNPLLLFRSRANNTKKHKYSDYKFFEASFKNSNYLGDFKLAKKIDIDNPANNKKKNPQNLTTWNISKLNHRNFVGLKNKRNKENKFNNSIISSKYDSTAKQQLKNGYNNGYNKQLEKADELKVDNLKRVKISYKYNKDNINYPLTSSLFSSNIYYDNDLSRRQNYTIYYSKDLNDKKILDLDNSSIYNPSSWDFILDVESNYNLYGGGKYLLIPNSYFDKNTRIKNLRRYTILLGLTTALKIYLSQELK